MKAAVLVKDDTKYARQFGSYWDPETVENWTISAFNNIQKMHNSLWWSFFTVLLDRRTESSDDIKGDILINLTIFMDAYNE